MPRGAIYNHETVALDGEGFDQCEFRKCRLVYAGGTLPRFSECRFDECEWRYGEAAARTLAYLRLVWGLGGKASVQALIKEVTSGGR
jgi:hypothetical protein